jgi:hypothetical protein
MPQTRNPWTMPEFDDPALSNRDRTFLKKLNDVVYTQTAEVGTNYSNTDTLILEMLLAFGFNEWPLCLQYYIYLLTLKVTPKLQTGD